jgi:hypothetical protein
VITDSEEMLFERGRKVKRSDSVGYWCGELAVADLPSHHGCIVEFYVVNLIFGPRILAGKCRETAN